MKNIIVFIASAALSTTALSYSGEQYVTCNLDPKGDNWVALRAAPNPSAKVLKKLPPATFVITAEPYTKGKWREVTVQKNMQDNSYTGVTGWVYTDYICEVRYR